MVANQYGKLLIKKYQFYLYFYFDIDILESFLGDREHSYRQKSSFDN